MCPNDVLYELRVQQVCKYPLVVSGNAANTNNICFSACSYCAKPAPLDEATNKPVNLPRCTRCFRSAYCNS